jgi:DNA polymerase-3 subunit gamma/tau
VTVAEGNPQQKEAGRNGAGEGPGGSAYRVLARKYRPRRFEDLVGQEPMVRTLANAFETGRIAQGYMLTGVRGVGKTTTARLIARALNYSLSEKPTVHMPAFGEHCEAILESRHVDVIEMDAASHTSVDNIREIIEQVRYRPVAARYKVYIIDEVHMLSRAAFNALLKTLEEPPEHVKFIFATTEIRKVPVTVLSRCQRFDLRRVEAGRLKQHLAWVCDQENVPAEEEALRMIARAAEGSVRDALSLLDQAIAYGQNAVRAEDVRVMLGLMDRARIIDLFEAVMAGRIDAALRQMSEQHALGADPAMVLVDLAAFTHLVTRMRILGEAGADEAAAEEERRRGLELARQLSMPVLSRAWQMLLKGIAEVQASSQPLAAAEMVLVRLAHAAEMPPPAELARRLLGTSGATAGGQAGGSASVAAGVGAPAKATTSAASAPALPRGQAEPARGEGRGGSGPERASAAESMPGHATGGLQPGNGAGERAQIAGNAAAPAKDIPAAAAAPQEAAGNVPDSLEAVAALAGEHRDLKLKHQVERHLRLVRMSPGRLEVALTDDAPRELPGHLATRLSEWTGRRWTVIVSDAPGSETLHEKRQRMKSSYLERAREDPAVRAVLEAFPEARILDVRPPEIGPSAMEADLPGDVPAADETVGDSDRTEEGEPRP